MRSSMVYCLITLYALTLMPLSARVFAEETYVKDFAVELVSYDFSSYAEQSSNKEESENKKTLWLRFQIYSSIQNLQIESFKVYMHTDKGRISLRELPIPEPNWYGFFYQEMSMDITDKDDEAITGILRESVFQCEIEASGIKGELMERLYYDVSVSKVHRETFQRDGDYSVRIIRCICKPIGFEEYFYYTYPGLKEYLESNPSCSFYSLEFFGVAQKKSEHLVLGVEYASKSEGVFLLKNGRNRGISTQINHADMIENGEMPVSIYGMLCVNLDESTVKKIEDLSIYALYSTEYAGFIDISDAGDRMDGPKVIVGVEMDHVIVLIQ